MTIYIIVGIVALIVLHKVYEERGSSWAYIFCLLVYAALGFYFNKFEIMYAQGIIQFLVELFLILIITFIYNKFMYLLYNCMNLIIIFLISASVSSYLFYLGVCKIYLTILQYALELIYKIL